MKTEVYKWPLMSQDFDGICSIMCFLRRKDLLNYCLRGGIADIGTLWDVVKLNEKK
jgi:hypothetical protein